MSNTEEMNRVKLEYARDYLRHMDRVRDDRDAALEKLEVITHAGQPGGIRYDRDKVRTSPTDDAIPNAVDKLISAAPALLDAVRQCDRECREFEDALCEAVERCQSVGATYLYCHYVLGLMWYSKHNARKTVAGIAGVSRQTVMNRCDEALIEMYDLELIPWQFRMPNHRAV